MVFTGDIQGIFHQVSVLKKIEIFFVFSGGDYQVHLFSAVSSPSCTNYALKKTADDNSSEFPAEVL